MDIKDIKKKLAKLESKEAKLHYLKELLKKAEDKDQEKFIKTLIKEIESLESKLDEMPDIAPIRKQIALDDVEHDIETREMQVTPTRPLRRPDLAIMPREEENLDVNYASSNYSINLVPQYIIPSSITYESLLDKAPEIGRIEESLVKENILNLESPLNELSREQLRIRVHELMPFATPEEVIRYEDKILNDLRDKKAANLRYIPKLR